MREWGRKEDISRKKIWGSQYHQRAILQEMGTRVFPKFVWKDRQGQGDTHWRGWTQPLQEVITSNRQTDVTLGSSSVLCQLWPQAGYQEGLSKFGVYVNGYLFPSPAWDKNYLRPMFLTMYEKWLLPASVSISFRIILPPLSPRMSPHWGANSAPTPPRVLVCLLEALPSGNSGRYSLGRLCIWLNKLRQLGVDFSRHP